MNFNTLMQTSINIINNSSFNKNNIHFICSNLSPKCNTFVSSQNSDGMQVDSSSFESFVNGLKANLGTGILCSEALNDVLAQTMETQFNIEFRDMPWENGILSLYSIVDPRSKQKTLMVRTYHGFFGLQRFALDSRGIAALPEMLKPPYDIIEYACMITVRPDFIYITSNTPLSMKAAFFVITNSDIYEPTLSNNRSTLIRLKHSPKMVYAEDFVPCATSISVSPLKNIMSPTP